MKKTNRGFTLIELLVVIAIIGLLSTLAVVALGTARSKARDAKRIADVKSVQGALEMYFSDKASYPVATAHMLGDTNHACLDNSAGGFTTSALCSTTQYMGIVPQDPSQSAAICVSGATAACAYSYAGSATGYTILFYLENATGGLATGLRTATQDGMK